MEALLVVALVPKLGLVPLKMGMGRKPRLASAMPSSILRAPSKSTKIAVSFVVSFK